MIFQLRNLLCENDTLRTSDFSITSSQASTPASIRHVLLKMDYFRNTNFTHAENLYM